MADSVKTSDEWREKLTEEQYRIMRQGGTEPPFSGKYANNHDTGMYHCAACDTPIFSSETKFDSETGWPSFFDADKTKLEMADDTGFGLVRTEIKCKSCGSHLGHLFDDGPKPTGLRYCINSAALNFKQKS